MENKYKWVELCDRLTHVMQVEGGSIYRSRMIGVEGVGMVFVPDVDLTRYLAHLRDAYKQGFADGAIDAHSQYKQCIKEN